jgi:hypothetical protein
MPRRSSRAVGLGIVPVLAASFLAGCGDDEETAYCVDESDRVVENRYCEEEGDRGVVGVVPFFWYFAPGGSVYTRGQQVPGTGERVRASDRAALARRGGFGSRASAPDGVGRPFTPAGRSGGG